MENKSTNISIDEIMVSFYKKSAKIQTEILWAALDYMNQYNGRTKWLCVAMAMGYDNNEGENSTYFKVQS